MVGVIELTRFFFLIIQLSQLELLRTTRTSSYRNILLSIIPTYIALHCIVNSDSSDSITATK